MAGLGRFMKRLAADQAGATAIEYGLVAALIGLAVVAAVITLSGGVIGLYNFIIDTAGAAIAGAA